MKNVEWCIVLGGTAIAAMVLFMVETMSIDFRFEKQRCVILEVQNDPEWGFIGEDKRTLVRFADGSRGYLPGDLGAVGEEMTTGVKIGTASLFGILGDMSWRTWNRKHKGGRQ